MLSEHHTVSLTGKPFAAGSGSTLLRRRRRSTAANNLSGCQPTPGQSVNFGSLTVVRKFTGSLDILASLTTFVTPSAVFVYTLDERALPRQCSYHTSHCVSPHQGNSSTYCISSIHCISSRGMMWCLFTQTAAYRTMRSCRIRVAVSLGLAMLIHSGSICTLFDSRIV